MPKVLGDNTQSEFRMVDAGLYLEKVTIKSVEDFSNYPLKKGEKKTIGKNGFEPELCLKITSNDDRDYFIFGQFNWKIDPISGKKMEYKGWKKTNNGVWNLLYNLLGEFTIGDDDSIPDFVLKKLINKSFYKLKFCAGLDATTGEMKLKDYNVYKNADSPKADEILLDLFYNDKYFYKKYDRNSAENYLAMKKARQFDPGDFPDNSNLQSPPTEDII